MKRLNPRPHYCLGVGIFLTLAALASGAYAQPPLTLSGAMSDVLRNSEEAQLLTEKETRLQAEKGEVLGAALPNVQLYADAGRGAQPFYIGSFPSQILGADSSGGGGGSPKSSSGYQRVYDVQENQFDYGVQVSQPLFSFRIGQAYHVAGIILHSQAEENRRSRQELELQTLDAFYALITARARIGVTEAAIKRQTETVGFLQSNLQMGSGQRSSVLLAVSALKALVPDRIRAERDTDAARMALNRLVGRPIEAPLEIDTAVPDFSVSSIDTSEAGLQNILGQRPDLNALRLQKESLQGQKSSRLPRGRRRVTRVQYRDVCGLDAVRRQLALAGCALLFAHRQTPRAAGFGGGHPFPRRAAPVFSGRSLQRLALFPSGHVDSARRGHRAQLSGKISGAEDAAAAGGNAIQLP